MPRYTVQHRYSARRDGQTLGPWVEGDETELTGDEAAWVNRDSPGTLAPVVDKPSTKPAEREAEPAKDRQHRGGRNRGT